MLSFLVNIIPYWKEENCFMQKETIDQLLKLLRNKEKRQMIKGGTYLSL